MKAILYDKKQKPSKFRFSDTELPVLKEGEVLIKIAYSSINAADTRSLKLGIVPKSKIFGSACSGTIEAVAKQVSGFKLGDEVLVDLSDFGFGSLAEYAKAPEKAVALKPASLSFKEAAALPVAATTALQALRDKGSIQAGQKVLIVGASGGVGGAALQIAKHLGAIVTAVCSSSKVSKCKELGADFVIDYRKENFTKSENRYDLIIAVNGNYPLLAYRKLLATNGTFVMVGGSLGQIFKSLLFSKLLSLGSKKMRLLAAKAKAQDLDLVAAWSEKGLIQANIIKQYQLQEAGEAIQFLSEGHAAGKVVIKVAEPKEK